MFKTQVPFHPEIYTLCDAPIMCTGSIRESLDIGPLFLPSALDKRQLLASRPGHFTTGDESRCLWKESRVYPRTSLYHEANNNNYKCYQTIWSAKIETHEVRRAMPLYLSVKLKAGGLQKGIKLRPLRVQELSPTYGCLCWSTKSCQAVSRIQ